MTLADDRRMELAEAGQTPLFIGYAEDPYTWALEQAELLRSGRTDLTTGGASRVVLMTALASDPC